MYSYPSYISIGTNNLDNIDTNWSQVGNTEKTNPAETGSKALLAKGAQRGSLRSKQTQAKQVPKKTVKQPQLSKQTQQSRQSLIKQSISKQSNSKQPVNKQISAKHVHAQKLHQSAIASRAKNIGSSKKQLVSMQNKRKSTGDVTNAVKNAKIKRKDNKRHSTTSLLSAQEIRRRSTNSMRLRKLTSAGEVCHDDSSESMSESERLAEAIRRSKLETRMTPAEVKKGAMNGTLNRQEKGKYLRKLKGKQVTQKTMHDAEDKGRKDSLSGTKRSFFRTKKDHFIGANQEHFVGHFKSSQKKSKKISKARSSLPSMVIPRPKLDAKRNSTSHSETKSNPTLKRSVSVPSKVPTTLMGKIIPIQAPMIWKLVNSSQEKSNPVDLAKIQNVKSKATLKFTGEQKVLIRFSQNNNNSNSTAVKTIIANVASPSKSPPKNSTGVKTRQAVLMPISIVNESNSEAKLDANKGTDNMGRPVRLLRSTTKVASNMPNYSIIPLSSLLSSSSAVSSIPHLFSTVQQKNAVKTTLTPTAQQLIAVPAKSSACITSLNPSTINEGASAATTTTLMSIASTTTKLKSTAATTTAVKLLVVSSLSSSITNSPPIFVPATQIAQTISSKSNQTISAISSAIQVMSNLPHSTLASTKQAFLPQTSKTLFIKHSANTPQVFTLIPTSGQQRSGQLQFISPSQVVQKSQVSIPSPAKVPQQFIRPIFIAAQPSMFPPKSTSAISKVVSSTPTVTTQAIFIATAPVNPHGHQSSSTIKLALSPSKPVFAGAIPLIFSPQAPASSSASLSSQLQHALSSLQLQNLVTMPTVCLQTSAASAVQPPPHPVSGLQLLHTERRPVASVLPTSNSSLNVVTVKSQIPLGVSKNPGTEQPSSKQNSIAGESIVLSEEFLSPKDSGDLVPAQANVTGLGEPSCRNYEKQVDTTLCSASDLPIVDNTDSLPDPVSPPVSSVSVNCGSTIVGNSVKELPSLEHVLPSVVGEKVSEQTEVAAPPEIFKYLPTLPGACTTVVAKSRERLTVKIPLSKLVRNTMDAYHTKSTPVISTESHSPKIDVADISQIIKHSAKIDLAFPKSNVEVTHQHNTNSATVVSDWNSAVPAGIVLPISVAQSAQLSSLAKSAMQRFVEIRPATMQSLKASNVAPVMISATSVINTAAIRTPIVTPAVTNSAVVESERSPAESLPVSIKLASVDSGVRLRNSKLISTVTKSSQPSTCIRNLPVQSTQAPLLPRPTQGYLAVLTQKPVSTLTGGQSSSAVTNQIQRFPVTYLKSLPVHMNNQARPPLAIQPARQGFIQGPLHPPPQNINNSNVRFGHQAVVIPVSLSLPRLNSQQAPVTSSILLSSLYPAGSTSGLKQARTPIQSSINGPPSQPPTAQDMSPSSKFQKLHPVTSIIARQSVVSDFTKPPHSIQGNLVTVSGGFPIQTNKETSTLKSTNANQGKPCIFSVEKALANPTVTLSVAKTATATTTASLSVTTVTSSCLASGCEASAVKEQKLSDGSDSLSQDYIAGLTNSLKGLLNTDITEGSTVTINIQGNPVTYALKDGKLFSMPHDLPAKKEKSLSVASEAEGILPSQENTNTPLSTTASSTHSVCNSIASSSERALSTTSAGDNPVPKTIELSGVFTRRQSDLPSPFQHLRISVPKCLLHRKIFRSKSASAGISAEKHKVITDSSKPSLSPTTVACSELNSLNRITSLNNFSCCSNSTTTISSSKISMSSFQPSNTVPLPSSFCMTLPSSTSIMHTSGPAFRSIFANGAPVSTCFSEGFSDLRQTYVTVEPRRTHSFSYSENRSQKDDDASGIRANSEPIDLKFGFECDFCSEKFESYNLMWRHRKLHLNDEANFAGLRRTSIPRALCPKFIACDQCSKVFHSSSDLECHRQQDNCVNNPGYSSFKENNNETERRTRSLNGRQEWSSSAADDINGLDLTFDLLTEDSHDVFQRDTSPDIVSGNNDAVVTASLGALTGEQFATNLRKKGQAMGELFNDLTASFIDSITPYADSVNVNGNGITVSNHKNDNFDINANLDDQVFDDLVDVKPDVKPAKIRRTSGRSSLPRKRIVSRKNSHITKSNANQRRNKRRCRDAISDDEETVNDDGLDLDGEFITVGKLHGEFTCSRCDLGFQNEEELDDHNESFHDSLRYNFRERRSVSNLEYLDEFEFDFE